MLLYAQDKNMK